MGRIRIYLSKILPPSDVAAVYRKFELWNLSEGGREAVRRLIRDSQRRSDREIGLDEVLKICEQRWRSHWSKQPAYVKADPFVVGDEKVALINKKLFMGMHVELKLPVPECYFEPKEALRKWFRTVPG